MNWITSKRIQKKLKLGHTLLNNLYKILVHEREFYLFWIFILFLSYYLKNENKIFSLNTKNKISKKKIWQLNSICEKTIKIL